MVVFLVLRGFLTVVLDGVVLAAGLILDFFFTVSGATLVRALGEDDLVVAFFAEIFLDSGFASTSFFSLAATGLAGSDSVFLGVSRTDADFFFMAAIPWLANALPRVILRRLPAGSNTIAQLISRR